jgi:hypothetical protein
MFVNSQASGETGLDLKFILFYLVIGGAQLFWMLPLMLGWANARLYVGIGCAILVSLTWIITNAPESVVGVEAPYDDLSIFIEGIQVLFIATGAMIILRGGGVVLQPTTNIHNSSSSSSSSGGNGSSNGGSKMNQGLNPELEK